MSQKPLPKIYDRPDRKFLSPFMLAIIAALILVIACIFVYRLERNSAAAEATSQGVSTSSVPNTPAKAAPRTTEAGASGVSK